MIQSSIIYFLILTLSYILILRPSFLLPLRLKILRLFYPKADETVIDTDATEWFRRNWPQIARSSYRKLVLPPQCRHYKTTDLTNSSINSNINASTAGKNTIHIVNYDYVGAWHVLFIKIVKLFLSILKGTIEVLSKPFVFGHRAALTSDELSTSTLFSSKINTSIQEDEQAVAQLNNHDSFITEEAGASCSNESSEMLEKRKEEEVEMILHSPRHRALMKVLQSFSAKNNRSMLRHPSDRLHFFDAPNSDAAMRQLSQESLIPDQNGYVLVSPSVCDAKNDNAEEASTTTSSTPLLVFVNPRSGLQQGHFLLSQLKSLLNPVQVYDLNEGSPEKILESFVNAFPKFRILVCGGDGTVSWIISAIEKVLVGKENKSWPPIAILPLGTGNDLARFHGWGAGYNNQPLLRILEQVSDSFVSMLDLWEIDVRNKKGKVIRHQNFMNYVSIGADSQAALQVHKLRESDPKLFFSRAFNKIWYVFAGGEEVLNASYADLPQNVILEADGVEIAIPPDSQGIIFLNIDSYMSGVPLWATGIPVARQRMSSDDFSVGYNSILANKQDVLNDTSPNKTNRFYADAEFNHFVSKKDRKVSNLPERDARSSCQDGLIDVVTITGTLHLGRIRMGISSSHRICQCKEAKLTILKKKIAVQKDGEPWMQNAPCTIQIRRKKNQARMLHRASDGKGKLLLEAEVSNLLDWAEERNLIDNIAHSAMMQELMRRTQMKNLQKYDSQDSFSLFG